MGFALQIQQTQIDDTFAEAFGMSYTRLVVTASDRYWLEAGVREFCGYSASVIACDAEAGRERWMDEQETPDGRVGASLLVFGFSSEGLAKAVSNRTGQCLMTCPSTAVYDGLPDAAKRLPLGKHLRFFGDGYQKSKRLDGRRYWRIPVMDGEFVVAESTGIEKGVAGGNLILQAVDQQRALASARRAAETLADHPGVITPFPGGVARSGSKVGSRYKGLRASTADAFCPSLRAHVASRLHTEANYAYEIVIDGVDQATVGAAMAAGMRAAAGDGVVAISAGNYGGKLGPYHFRLHELLGAGS
ncbi:MAG: formylmethanofuran--tetrahydromethanopterin N-formyltransferase [Pirellulaceae bacterium]|nr:formylmethanofuran--tetrahydromethanopterin N-formyltransferase [Pirellulaceae bacterium]